MYKDVKFWVLIPSGLLLPRGYSHEAFMICQLSTSICFLFVF